MKTKLSPQNKMRLSNISRMLAEGVAEYYSRVFSILVEWDGKLTFTLHVQLPDKQIVETSIIGFEFGDLSQEPPLLVVWDKVLDERDRLKTKYILNH